MKNKPAFFTLLITQILFTLFLLVWAVFLAFSVMMFDSPGSEDSLALQIIFYSIMAYPLGLIAGIATSWYCYVRGLYNRAYWFNCIPLLWLLPIVLFWGYALFLS